AFKSFAVGVRALEACQIAIKFTRPACKVECFLQWYKALFCSRMCRIFTQDMAVIAYCRGVVFEVKFGSRTAHVGVGCKRRTRRFTEQLGKPLNSLLVVALLYFKLCTLEEGVVFVLIFRIACDQRGELLARVRIISLYAGDESGLKQDVIVVRGADVSCAGVVVERLPVRFRHIMAIRQPD